MTLDEIAWVDGGAAEPDAAEDEADQDDQMDAMEMQADPYQDDARTPAGIAGGTPRMRRSRADALYGELPVSRWAQALLDLEPFARLAGVSLSDVPGDLLVGRPFPSRLTHSLGVYYLARQARPRDRTLHAAALAHDLGHGPFSHLTEPLMIERLGMDHEQRGAVALRQALASLHGPAARLLAWLDPDEVTALMLGGGSDGRGRLLNGLMDYDNLDNVARFLQAAGLGEPTYDPRALARELRLAPSAEGTPEVALSLDAAAHAIAWQADRRRVYRFLGEGERNLAMHGMLRKAVDLAAQAQLIEPDFFDATDAQALRLLREGASPGAAALADAVMRDQLYLPVWEANAPENAHDLSALFAQWRSRLDVEERVATEAALLPYEVVLSYTVARGERSLPPLLSTERGRAESTAAQPLAPSQPAVMDAGERCVTLFIARTAGRDYARRARMAAERTLGSLGALPRVWANLQ